jgi:pantoate--beta-alanine ligase
MVVSTCSQLDEARGDAILASFADTGRRPILGFVPTMGALHAGHASLLSRMAECDVCIASIFVNPRQFGANEDLSRYPHTPEADHALCEAAGVDILWAPQPGEMYPRGYQTTVQCGDLAGTGAARRARTLDGVATVVAKLLGASP